MSGDMEMHEIIDAHIMRVFDDAGAVPMYDMLRYFMGYPNTSHPPSASTHGKRTRSVLLLTVAELFGGAPSALDLAAAVELYHNFTLIHDEIEDHDELRRGQETVWKVWGVNHGINAGDAQLLLVGRCLLRAAASDECAARAAALLNRHFLEVIEGQYLDFVLTDKPLDDPAVNEAAYLEMIRKKTAVLIGAAVAAGGTAAGCDTEAARGLYEYGESLGMAYQIRDDLVSVWGETGETGKIAHGDILERKKTYPVLFAREHGDAARLLRLYKGNTALTEAQVREVVVLLDASGAEEATRARAEAYLARGRTAAEGLSLRSEAKATLVALLEKVAASAGVTHHA